MCAIFNDAALEVASHAGAVAVVLEPRTVPAGDAVMQAPLRNQEHSMYVVTVEFGIRAEHVVDFRAAVTENARTSCDTEPGCRQFDVCIAPQDPRVVFLYEVYVDRAAFDAHLESAHFKAFDSRVATWVESKTVRTYTRADAA